VVKRFFFFPESCVFSGRAPGYLQEWLPLSAETICPPKGSRSWRVLCLLHMLWSWCICLVRFHVRRRETVAQTISVVIRGNRCRVTYDGKTVEGYCGRQGGTYTKVEGDGKTPLGTFPIRFGFFRRSISTRLPMVKLHPYHLWVDDPHHPMYNRLLFVPPWQHPSGEVLYRYDRPYRLGLVVEYNRHPILPGRGSAIFIHCGHRPTAGCIAIPYDFLRYICQNLDPRQHPEVVIR